MTNLEIRPARPDECHLVLAFIKLIAEYERLTHLVEATEAMIHQALFVNHDCEVVIAFEAGAPVGFALYFYNFSTFKGKKGLYLEDLYVKEEYRHRGYGKALITYLIRQAKAQQLGRMEWTCLNWNRSAIDFYTSLGARPLKEWTVFRLDEEAIQRF